MKILVIGSGAREHAIVKACARSSQLKSLYCIGTTLNPGINQYTRDYLVANICDCEAVVTHAQQWGIDLAIIGPEAPLERGMADALWQAGIATIGPKKALAQLETSKQFARDLMHKYQIAGLPRYQKFTNLAEAESFLQVLGEGNYVIKADGLMGGKGVKVAGDHLHSFEEALSFCQEILNKNQSFIIEEKLIGQEFSLMCFADGKHLIPMPLVQDHKRAYEGDKGPNTGGMGSYSAANHRLPFLLPEEVNDALAINHAVFEALMQECGEKYLGILYGSFIATKKGVYVIEFNTRFGDPEALNVLTLLTSDFLVLCRDMINGHLREESVCFARQATVCKYLVPEGYPDSPCKDFALDFSLVEPNNLYLASVNQQGDQVLAAGSRTAAYVGVADTLAAAEAQAEREISKLVGPVFHRKDIGTEPLIEQRVASMLRIRGS